METIQYKIDSCDNIELLWSEGVFRPTETSKLLYEASLNKVKENSKVLDLGCGTGVLGIALKRYKPNFHLYASDIDMPAIEVCRKNLRKHKIEATLKQGSMFDCWNNGLFDLIINDISGIAESVASISPWFDGVSCSSGIEGDRLTCDIIKKSHNFLANSGKLILPIISLSNTEKILDILAGSFNNTKKIISREWPLPNDLYDKRSILDELKSKKIISFEEKFGMLVAKTEIWEAYS